MPPDYPTQDPHGDPIPDSNGSIPSTQKLLLAKAKQGHHCICVGVKDSSSDFLKYLDKYKIALGSQIKVISKEAYDKSMTVIINDIQKTISKDSKENIFLSVWVLQSLKCVESLY